MRQAVLAKSQTSKPGAFMSASRLIAKDVSSSAIRARASVLEGRMLGHLVLPSRRCPFFL
jgi:hypothetical protein